MQFDWLSIEFFSTHVVTQSKNPAFRPYRTGYFHIPYLQRQKFKKVLFLIGDIKLAGTVLVSKVIFWPPVIQRTFKLCM
jgi:hypothetical protein